MNTKQIKLPLHNIVVEIDYDDLNRPICGDISSDLKVKVKDQNDENFNLAMSTIHRMILSHAMSEMDITSSSYIEGLEHTIDCCHEDIY